MAAEMPKITAMAIKTGSRDLQSDWTAEWCSSSAIQLAAAFSLSMRWKRIWSSAKISDELLLHFRQMYSAWQLYSCTMESQEDKSVPGCSIDTRYEQTSSVSWRYFFSQALSGIKGSLLAEARLKVSWIRFSLQDVMVKNKDESMRSGENRVSAKNIVCRLMVNSRTDQQRQTVHLKSFAISQK